ncbi:MAG: hypothetical protein K2K84_03135 [Muribaculaceae bacterium]|nr:hypothetical protein [Muribaculaceae bacterium]
MTKCPGEIITAPFSVTPSQYIGRVMGYWLSKWGWILLLPFFVCGMLAFIRWEWLIVAFILLLIIYPFILVMLYFTYGLSEEGINTVKPQRIGLINNRLIIKYLVRDDETGEFIPSDEKLVDLDSIKSVSESDRGVTIRLKGNFYKHIFVPDDSLNDQRINFITLLKENGTLFV